jgi:hypothetical protein
MVMLMLMTIVVLLLLIFIVVKQRYILSRQMLAFELNMASQLRELKALVEIQTEDMNHE